MIESGDYISRSAAIKRFTFATLDCLGMEPTIRASDVVLALQSIPAADVRPVVRAHWYWDKDGMDWGIGAWRCSACNTMSPMWWNTDKGSPMHRSGHSYCPICGAYMLEGEE